MKLIDILVQELPKRGGWPVGVDVITMHDDGDVYFDGKNANGEINLPQCSDGWGEWMSGEYSNAVSFEQYSREYLAASKVPVWDGEGLPPVGCECEYLSSNASWGPVKIIGYDGKNVVFRPSGDVYYSASPDEKCVFLPIRTEAERKREEALQALSKVLLVAYSDDGDDSNTEAHIYDAIAAGKIPGIRLTDDAGIQ